jgi:hypothetical protein
MNEHEEGVSRAVAIRLLVEAGWPSPFHARADFDTTMRAHRTLGE